MSVFQNEKDMQQWLQGKLNAGDSIGDLICNLDFFHLFQPQGYNQTAILESFKHCRGSLWCNELISSDANISQTKGEVLRPDFLLYGAEAESVVIVELKNTATATRQAGTEASAYAAEVRSYVPLISDGDVVNVIISTAWPTLLRHYIANEIIWSGRRIICLEPTISDGTTIQLSIISPQTISPETANAGMSDLEIGGYQLCLYDDELYGPSPDRNRFAKHEHQMLTALHAMSAKGNALRGHGFAFLWKDTWEQSLAPYSITVVNSAPFQGLRQILRTVQSMEELSEIHLKFINLVHQFDPAGHGKTLDAITNSAREMLKHFCSPRMEGFTEWRGLREIMIPRAKLLSFSSWGIFQDQHFENVRVAYVNGETSLTFDEPLKGLESIDQIVTSGAPYIDVSHLFGDEDDDFDELPSEFDDLDP